MKAIKFKILAIALLAFTSAISYGQTKTTFEDTVEITIDKSTTDEDFNGIKTMLEEHAILAEFENIKRNENKEITAISIRLSSESGQQTSSSISSNKPIGNISFGSKNGNLYIGQAKNSGDLFALFNNNSFNMPFDMDSIFGGTRRSLNLKDFFNGNSNFFIFENDSLDIDAIKKKFQQNFNFNQNSPNNFSYFYSNDNDNAPQQKFRFVDNPDLETLIVIDGKISDFKTLDRLAKTDKLKTVDILKTDAAMSIYGDKAKDGAIIAITKD
ncbi:hypothetical protein ACFQ1Q_12150 [Winogradskyella litorisediminis]|uniref:TonB-dependent receptor plug domain-containing protein n=1 Tax=Winogradskyella litorisediminis TaxID=1156618 RepID=A0ABW3NBH8_9FLAO